MSRALALVAVMAGAAHAQVASPAPSTSSTLPPAPADAPLLEIDDCKPVELAKDEVFKQGSEHYERGETLYVQGDYEGAVRELVYSYCLVPSFYTILKDIGQAYERNLDYERAIAYLERYVRAVPADAKRANDCASDPQQDKLNVARRLEVLRKLRAKLSVESSPAGAHITIGNADGVAARARAGDAIEVLGGRYEMTTELDGYAPHRQTIEVRIGKPYTYFVPLVALKGQLSLRVTPPDARVFLGDRLVGIGRVELALEGNTYTLTTEAPDRITDRRTVEVLANQVQHVQIELAAQPQFGRRQLVAFSTLAAGGATALLLSTFQNDGLAALGSLGGAAAGFVGSSFLLPRDLPLATSNLSITSAIAGGVFGAGASLVFTSRGEVIQPVIGAGIALGGAVGYVVGRSTKLTEGDAALINSGVVWGSVAGSLFAASFDPGHVVGGGLVLSGLGMGAVGGVLVSRKFAVSRTHAALIDVGGVLGIIGGLAVESLGSSTKDGDITDQRIQEHVANYAIGGLAIGLVGAALLTRNLDAPKIPVSPVVTQARDGATLVGVAGRW